jgi:hypothetical protein
MLANSTVRGCPSRPVSRIRPEVEAHGRLPVEVARDHLGGAVETEGACQVRARPARDDPEDQVLAAGLAGLGVDEAVDDLVDGAVAADGHHEARPASAASRARHGGVAGRLGPGHVVLDTALAQGGDQAVEHGATPRPAAGLAISSGGPRALTTTSGRLGAATARS